MLRDASSTCTQSTALTATAQCNAVHPLMSCRFTTLSLPLSRSCSKWACPCEAAEWDTGQGVKTRRNSAHAPAGEGGGQAGQPQPWGGLPACMMTVMPRLSATSTSAPKRSSVLMVAIEPTRHAYIKGVFF